MVTVPTPENFVNVESPQHFQDLLSRDLERISLINFWASWAEPCQQMNQVVLELARRQPDVLVLQVEADTLQDISESFEIEAVPSFIVLRGHMLLSRINGADAPGLTNALAKHSHPNLSGKAQTNRSPEEPVEKESEEELVKRMKKIMQQSRVVLFMKGSPDAPRCGFSRQTVSILRDHDIEFTHFDILQDEAVRQGLKALNNWPTFPQLIVGGEFIGGLDIIQEAVETGEFETILKA